MEIMQKAECADGEVNVLAALLWSVKESMRKQPNRQGSPSFSESCILDNENSNQHQLKQLRGKKQDEPGTI